MASPFYYSKERKPLKKAKIFMYINKKNGSYTNKV